MAKRLGDKNHMPVSVAVRFYLQRGLTGDSENGQNVPEKGTGNDRMPIETLAKGGEKAATKGMDSLRAFLRTLTPQEEQRLKYDLSTWRKDAQAHDDSLRAVGIKKERAEAIERLDVACLSSVVDYTAAWESVTADVRATLKTEHKAWIKDAERSDKRFAYRGVRPNHRIGSEGERLERADMERQEREFSDRVNNPDPLAHVSSSVDPSCLEAMQKEINDRNN